MIFGQFKGVWGLPERQIGQFWAIIVEIWAIVGAITLNCKINGTKYIEENAGGRGY